MLDRIVAILAEPITDQITLARTELRNLIMATAQDLQTKVDALTANVADMKTRVAEDIDAILALLEAGQVDQATIDAVAAKLDAVNATVAAIDPIPDTPTP